MTVSLGRDGQLLLNAYTGAVLGEGAVGLRAFFRSVTDWHRWLAASGEYRATGRAVTGASNLAFLVLVVTGAYLWLPKVWSRVQLRNILWFRRGLPGKARDFNWHNTIGVWSVVAAVRRRALGDGHLLSVGEQPRLSRDGRRAAGAAAAAAEQPREARRERGARRPERRRRGRARRCDPGPCRAAGGRLAQHQPRVPTAQTAPLVFTIDQGSGGQPQKRGTLTLNRATGAVEKWEPFASNSPGPSSARSFDLRTRARCWA